MKLSRERSLTFEITEKKNIRGFKEPKDQIKDDIRPSSMEDLNPMIKKTNKKKFNRMNVS